MRGWGSLIGGMILLLALPAWGDVQVKSVRMWPSPDSTRLVFDLSAPVEHRLFTLKSPQRIVIDLKNSHFSGSLPSFDFSNSHLKNIRYAQRKGNGLRFVLDLNASVHPKSFVLKPHGKYTHRLVIDLHDAATPTKRPRPVVPSTPGRLRDVIIVIDAGHGGDDPGASGRLGTLEKNVVLAIAKRLSKLVDKEPGMRAVKIRNGDYYVGLKQRVNKTRRNRADLFISIHADAFNNHRARGSSVFVLSDRGASSEAARFLAQSENEADLIGGVSLDDKDDLLRYVLVDMVKNSTVEDSHDIAARVLKDLGQVNKLHKKRVEHAGFRVLKSTGIPSILVETAFISNPQEERKLRDPKHQQALANAMMKGIRSYFRANPPVGSRMAMSPRRHKITRGETLSGIAAHYRVSVSALRQQNGLHGDRLHVGEVLRIPI